ncbi:Isoleucine--tRNA ligase, cytoplasmic [Camellia lanceoleosa]|uniref:Isoleucine--tRNA ligase, cytoplasmic n=1 Tax=Camellia lanceoleosa TaxID=1840588 RepID=A0ACC0H287_9ERIC|nr:Isoleucine--tRNA ligase, cytoplasmic [Camellia lanceoleosa]
MYVLEELNVKSIVPCNDPLKYAFLRAEPEFSVLGKRLGKSMPVVAKEVKAMSQEDILAFEKSREIIVAAHSLKLTDIKNACSFRYFAVEVDVTLQPEELEVMNKVLHAKYEEASRRRSCVVSGRISVTWLPRMRRRGNGKCRKRMENRRKKISSSRTSSLVL